MRSRGKQHTMLAKQCLKSKTSKLRAPESTPTQVRDDGVTQVYDKPSAPLVLSTLSHAHEAQSKPITPTKHA